MSMTDTTTIRAEKSKETKNYAVYESGSELGRQQEMTGSYISLETLEERFGEAPEFIEVEVSAFDPTEE